MLQWPAKVWNPMLILQIELKKYLSQLKHQFWEGLKYGFGLAQSLKLTTIKILKGLDVGKKRCRKIWFGYLQAQDWPVYANPASSYFFMEIYCLVHEVFRLFQNFFLGGFRLSWSFKFARHKWELQPWNFESDITRASISVLWCSSKHFNKTGKMSDERWAPFRTCNFLIWS